MGVWRARTHATRRWLVVAVVVVIAIGAGGAAWAKTRSSGTTVTTALATVSKGTVKATVSATGTLTPAHQADLSFAVSGTVTAVRVAEGDKVRSGEVLATIGRSALRADLDAARASVTAAREQLSTNLDADASDTALAADRANLRSAKSARRSAAEALADASLRSTVTGTVVSVDLAAGDQVSGSGSSSPGGGTDTAATTTGTITVISTDAFDVDASVGASDLASLKKGLQAQITPTGSQQTLFGTVSSVGLVAESSTSGTSTFPVSIAVTGKVSGVYAGSSATVSIIVRQLTDVLTVPTAAVHTTNGRTTVTVSAGGKTHQQAVTIGDVFGAQTVVTKGLAVGDQVVIATLRLPSGSSTTNRTGNGQTGFGGGEFPGAGGGGPPTGFDQGGQGPQTSIGGGQ